jgi:hypothetical protein
MDAFPLAGRAVVEAFPGPNSHGVRMRKALIALGLSNSLFASTGGQDHSSKSCSSHILKRASRGLKSGKLLGSEEFIDDVRLFPGRREIRKQGTLVGAQFSRSHFGNDVTQVMLAIAQNGTQQTLRRAA